jgi:putative ABC transport system permease protein
MRTPEWLSALPADFRQAARVLARHPRLVLAATLTFALGTGGTTAVFRVVDQVLLRQPPYRDPEQLVVVWASAPSVERSNLSAPLLLDLQKEATSFTALASFNGSSLTVEHSGGEPVRIRTGAVGAEFFSLLGVQPQLGRTFLPGENRPGHRNVLVLGHSLWAREFHADPAVVGSVLRCNHQAYEIVGVLPAGFDFQLPGFFSSAEMWTPATLSPEEARIGDFSLRVLGRLRSDRSLAAAQTEATRFAALERRRSPALAGFGLHLVPLHEQTAQAVRPSIVILFGAMSLVLLIACVNVSNLLLAQATARRAEFAVRTALGAPRSRILRQLVLESVILSVLGGICGVVLASLLRSAVDRLAPHAISGAASRTPILLFALLVSTASGIVAGLVPAWRSSAVTRPGDTLGRESRSAQSRVGLRGGLVAAQVALALPLLVGAGLLVKTLSRLADTSPGFNSLRTLTMAVVLPPAALPEAPPPTLVFRRLLDSVRALPGVTAAAAIDDLPLTSDRDASTYRRSDRPPLPPEKRPLAEIRTVSGGYFRTLEIPLLAGRDFAAVGPSQPIPEAIINQHAAVRLFPGEDPVGHAIALSSEPAPPRWLTIVGVARDVHDMGLDDSGHDEIYLPLDQNPATTMHLVLRTVSGHEVTAAAFQDAVRAVDPGIPRFPVRTLGSVVASSLEDRRLRAQVLASFGCTALLLAAIGIYGVMAFAVRSRTREIAIRLALGARHASVLRLLLGQGMTFVGLGVGTGLVLTGLLVRSLRGLLVGVAPFDPSIVLAAIAVLGGVGLASCAWPALRALRAEPTSSLRAD